MRIKDFKDMLEKCFYKLTKNKIDEFDWEEYSFKNKIKVYRYSISRKYIKQIRIKLIKEKNNICDKCKLTFDKSLLELDHKIPIILGGDVYKKNNLQILCRNCHDLKNHIDIKIINLLKSLSILKKVRKQEMIISIIHPKKIKQLYPYLFDFIFKLGWSWGNFGNNNLNHTSYVENLWREDGN